MPKNPRHRPANTKRIESMLRWLEVALGDTVLIEKPENMKELYVGQEFPHSITGVALKRELELTLMSEDDLVKHELSDEEENVWAWHDLHGKSARRLSNEPRSDRMLAYKIAASLFNSQLETDQRGDPILGIAPRRLDEKPTTAGALQVAIHRALNAKSTSV